MLLTKAGGSLRVARNDKAPASGRLTAARLSRSTALRYVYPQEVEALLFYNGYEIRTSYGSWQQEPLTATSREMIVVCQKRG
jgi:hypothetical protein